MRNIVKLTLDVSGELTFFIKFLVSLFYLYVYTFMSFVFLHDMDLASFDLL